MSKPNIEKEIRRAKELAALFGSLERAISNLPKVPEVAPVTLDEQLRIAGNAWIDSHTRVQPIAPGPSNRRALRA